MGWFSTPEQIREDLEAGRVNPPDPHDPSAYPGFFDEAWASIPRGLHAGMTAAQAAVGRGLGSVLLPLAEQADVTFGTGFAGGLEDAIGRASQVATEANQFGATTMGTGSQIVKGVAKGLTEAAPAIVAGPAGPLVAMGTVGASEGVGSYDEAIARGVDEETARWAALATGVTAGLGALMPVTWGLRGIVPNLATSAAANAGLGAAGRYANSTILAGAGYQGMAEQYRVWDGEALATDAILGAAFTGFHQWRAGRVEPSPAAVDDALAIREARHADTDTAPGLPATPEAMAAHLDALAEIERAVVEGRQPNFDGTGIHDVDFVRDPAREAWQAEAAAEVAKEIEPAPRPEADAPPTLPPAEAGRRIAADIRDKLVAAGRAPEEAEAGGALWGAFFRTFVGERGGFDAWETYRTLGLDVRDGLVLEQPSPFRRFDIARTEALFNRQLDAALRGEASRRALNLGRTPPVLQELGLDLADIALPKSVLDKAIASRDPSSPTAGKHNTKIGPDHIADLVRAIADPVAVFADDDLRHGPGRLVVITDLEGKGGDPVAVVVGPRGQLGDGQGNVVPTVHERTHPMGPMLYVRDAEDIPRLPQSWTTSPGGTGSSGASATPTVLTKADIVNKHGSVFYQDRPGDPRASVSFGDRQILVRLFEAADESSFVHESAHIWLEMLGRAGEMEHPGARALWNDVREALGIKEGEAPTVEQHEAFAEGFEAYLRDGKAPTPALADVFARFGAWLRSVYADLTALGGPVPEGLRRIYDRMLATDAEIAAAHGAEAGPQPLEVLAARQALAERPNLTIGVGDDGAAPAHEVLARHDAEIAQATELSRLIETAAACALRA
ncbi:MAG: hypothetical protein RLZZ501_1960 [Pseudomonadota bacterium]|jgi:hypothetical protein